jgi:hypothetical protein
MNKYWLVVHSGQYLFRKVLCLYTQARGIYARMAAEILAFQNILVYQQLYAVFLIVRKAEHAYRAGGEVEKAFKILRVRKAKARGANLIGNGTCGKMLFRAHHKQIEMGFRSVTEKKVFADRRTQNLVYFGTRLYFHSGVMVYAVVGNAYTVEKIVCAYLFFKPSRSVGRSALLSYHKKSPCYI